MTLTEFKQFYIDTKDYDPTPLLPPYHPTPFQKY